VRGARALRTADGAAAAVPDFADCYAARAAVLGRRLLWLDRGPNNEQVLRLRDLDGGRDVWSKEYPEKAVLLDSAVPGLVAAAAPDGTVEVTDLRKGKEAARLAVDRGYLEKVKSGCLLADEERFYVAWVELRNADAAVVDVPQPPQPLFSLALGAALPINGRVYAFGRDGGEPLWYKDLPHQHLLLERFDRLPVVLAGAYYTRKINVRGGQVQMAQVRSLDKRTGKLCFDRESVFTNDVYTALHVDPRAGTADLVAAGSRLRHQPGR
jgi:hypothetical protein